MADEQTQKELERRYRGAVAIIAVQISAAAALTVAAWFLAGRTNVIIPAEATTVLWVILLVVAVGAFLLRRMLFAPAALRNAATLKGARGLLQSLQAKTVLLAALGEAIAVIGFLIALASGDWLDMLRAAAVALIVFFISFPRKSAWRRVAQAAS